MNPRTEHSCVHNPSARADVIAAARRAAERSGASQWIHEHPHGYPCNAKCGPIPAAAS